MEVTYVDHMGGDTRVVNAARVSFAKRIPEDILRGQDEGLINYLAEHGHWTPFSHVVITMVEKVPIFVARQRFKHFIGFVYGDNEEDGLEATYNETSRRYVDTPPEFFIPDAWRKRAEDKKQGSSDEIVLLLEDWNPADMKESYQELINFSSRLYETMIKNGVAPEQARIVLPQSMMTEYYVTGSLAAWARAYKLRIDGHAQKEIQDLAKEWNSVISNIKGLEHSWRALTG